MVSLSGISPGSVSASTRPSTRTAPATAASSSTGGKELTPDQQAQVRTLQKTDAQVKAHEQAHKAAGGSFAGGIQYQYTTGPDGRRYATAGEVPIDVSPERGDPDATIAKMEIVKRAALAPQDPSPEDRAVAAKADAIKAQAESERSRGGKDGGDQAAADDKARPGPLQAAAADANADANADASAAARSAGAVDVAAYRQAARHYGRALSNSRPGLSITA